MGTAAVAASFDPPFTARQCSVSEGITKGRLTLFCYECAVTRFNGCFTRCRGAAEQPEQPPAGRGRAAAPSRSLPPAKAVTEVPALGFCHYSRVFFRELLFPGWFCLILPLHKQEQRNSAKRGEKGNYWPSVALQGLQKPARFRFFSRWLCVPGYGESLLPKNVTHHRPISARTTGQEPSSPGPAPACEDARRSWNGLWELVTLKSGWGKASYEDRALATKAT